MRSSEGRVIDLPAYLEALGLPDYAAALLPIVCDVCGARQAQKLRDTVRVVEGVRTRFATLCCVRCGLLFQSPRFSPEFYDAYYAQVYRLLVGGGVDHQGAYVQDQIARGEALLDSLHIWLPPVGRLLDVGCGAGGMMQPFIERGWTALGVDPDKAAIANAIARGLPVVASAAETMVLDRGHYDLIIITGSLEHVRDPNAVLARCHEAAGPGSLLLIEAHGLGQAAHVGEIGHNHRRLLTGTTMTLLMLRHGWTVEWITDRPLSGPTRPGSTFALGRRSEAAVSGVLLDAIANGVRETPEAIEKLLRSLRIR